MTEPAEIARESVMDDAERRLIARYEHALYDVLGCPRENDPLVTAHVRMQEIEAGDAEISRLRAALAEAEAERDRLRDALRRIAEQRYSAGDAPYIAARALTRPAAQPEGEHD